MVSGKTGLSGEAAQETGTVLSVRIREISDGCIRCQACQKECAFLRKYGKPGEIAETYNPADRLHQAMPFECSLCRLCAAVCPAKLNPAEMFLEMRREKMRRDPRTYPEHGRLLAYEKRGNSRLFSCYALPPGCDTVFFAGCALPGTRPEQTLQLYRKMKQEIPSLGIVLDCCNKISHDLGRQEHFRAMFGKMRDYLVEQGVKKVIAACPNCYRMFDEYGTGLSVSTAYEVLAEQETRADSSWSQTVFIHDPCGLRFREEAQAAVRRLVTSRGVQIEELRHHGRITTCCGEGGSVGCLSPELAGNWGKRIQEEAGGRRILTYCAGCANHLSGLTPTGHVVDFVCNPGAALAGKAKVSKAPVTYLNRLRLKWRLRKEVAAAATRERNEARKKFDLEDSKPLKSHPKNFFLMLGSVAALAVLAGLYVLVPGVNTFVNNAFKILSKADVQALRAYFLSFGPWAPVTSALLMIFQSVIAPLPAFVITFTNGLLFGAFWGTLLSWSSAMAGAALCFFLSRIFGRPVVEKLAGAHNLDLVDKFFDRYGKHAIIVARLLPFVPFDPISYGAGLTGMSFWGFFLATGVGQLPATIVYSYLGQSASGTVKVLLFVFAVVASLVIISAAMKKRYERRLRGDQN